MMKNEKANYSTSKGYPYDKVISQERFKHRLITTLDMPTRKVTIEADKRVYPDFKAPSWIARLFGGKVIDFFMFRLLDYNEALIVAEQQIIDLLTDAPFIPEEFGFFKAIKPKSPFDNPAVVYVSRYDSSISLFRDPTKDSSWILTTREKDDEFKTIELNLLNHRIAYAAFFALGIQVEGEYKEDNSYVVKDIPFTATYTHNDADPVTIKFRAHEDSALDIAAFILEKTIVRAPVDRSKISVQAL